MGEYTHSKIGAVLKVNKRQSQCSVFRKARSQYSSKGIEF